ncbi:MAG: PKD domain-containing protein [Saprospiraceae bacterium]|nr:PKD domain-containing protein [Saprospiraceae bacterium]
MKRRFPIFAFVLLYLVECPAQKHDFVWMYGYNSNATEPYFGGSVIDFNSEPPLVYRQDRDMNLDITFTSSCDSLGILQFYSNGIAINDSTNNTMANGHGLNPGEFANNYQDEGYILVNSMIALPVPDSSHKIALFHLKLDYHPVYVLASTTFYITIIDMNLNNGLGKVIVKNQELLTNGRFGMVNAVKHANGRDWWIYVTDEVENNYSYFLLAPEGLQGPFEFQATPSFCCPHSLGQIVFSPDGNKVARYNVEHGVYFYDFDRCTGEFDNPVFITLPDGNVGGGIAFSPNSRFFYLVHDYLNVYQYDLWADDIAGSKVIVAKWDGFFTDFNLCTCFFELQLGPDGRIYGNAPNSVEYLHVIDQPNKKGTECKFQQHGLQLPTLNRFTSPHFPYYRLGPLDGSPCDTLGLDNHPVAKFRCSQDSTDYLTVEFTDQSTYEPNSWSWLFGDGSTSQDTSPVHTYAQPGIYEVCLTVANDNSTDTYCKTLEIATSATSEAQPLNLVSVFPNPAQSATNFRIGEGYLPRQAMLTLRTTTGQVVHTQRLMPGWSVVGLEGMAPGLYFWEVKDACLPGQDKRVLGTGKLIVVE